MADSGTPSADQKRPAPASTDLAFSDREGVTRGTRAFLVHPFVRGVPARRSPDAALEELAGLAEAIQLTEAGREACGLPTIRPATYLGTGKVKELADKVRDTESELVIVDCQLTPGQQQNLERDLKAKVIDRTGLILEIFGDRARTKEGVLQVELAHLSYQRGRLVRSWTHLERQRGGAGFLGGPGERQIEADRRVLSDRIGRLKRELETVTRTRTLHRKSRQKVPYPVVALVGYTNAGKSTLFNRLTTGGVFADDMLFATLDPTMRGVTLRSGRRIILSDTVGFVSDLPTHLVAAFRATLEEVLEADILLHVRDIAHVESDEQKADVLDVLQSLGAPREGQQLIEVCNKIDMLDAAECEALQARVMRRSDAVAMSAQTGEGMDDLLNLLNDLMLRDQHMVQVQVPYSDGATIAWLYDHGDVLDREDQEDGARFQVRLSDQAIGRLRKQTDVTLSEAAE